MMRLPKVLTGWLAAVDNHGTAGGPLRTTRSLKHRRTDLMDIGAVHSRELPTG